MPSLATKAATMAFVLASLCVVVAVSLVLLQARARGGDEAVIAALRNVSSYELAAGLVPIVVATVATYLYGRIVTRARVEPIADAMNRMAAGDLEPPRRSPREREFEPVEDSMHAMRSVLGDAFASLAHQDSQRRRFFADLAHDLASPVSTVLSIVDTLSAAGIVEDPSERERLFRMLERESERLAHLVRDIRELAYLDDPDVSFHRERADLGDVVRGVVESFSVGKGARLESHTACVFAEIDAMRIEQVIHNLVQNARKHTPPEGAIRVHVEAIDHAARIVVEDDGPGVSDEALEKLGERFYRPDAARQRQSGGHGLGLSIVAAIVDRHDGRIVFERASSGGLRVVIDLPRAAPRMDA